MYSPARNCPIQRNARNLVKSYTNKLPNVSGTNVLQKMVRKYKKKKLYLPEFYLNPSVIHSWKATELRIHMVKLQIYLE